MPTYTYRCKECNHQFDTSHSITADPLTDCPECSDGSLRRVINYAPGIAFKGSGFYVTDNNKQASKAPVSSPKESACSSANDSPTCVKCPKNDK
ncbi:MAG: FmdB family zinc ribbon protein [Candidatus Margulisiibacteriota bacterium]